MEKRNPYAAPRARRGAPASASLDDEERLPRVEGDIAVVVAGYRFRKMCLKCGARGELQLTDHEFAFTPRRGFSPWVFLGALGLLISQLRSMRRARFSLPLCARCANAWTNAKYATWGMIAVFTGAFGWFLYERSQVAPAIDGPLVALVVTIAALVIIQRLFAFPRTVRCVGIDERSVVRLAGICRPTLDALSRPRKKRP